LIYDFPRATSGELTCSSALSVGRRRRGAVPLADQLLQVPLLSSLTLFTASLPPAHDLAVLLPAVATTTQDEESTAPHALDDPQLIHASLPGPRTSGRTPSCYAKNSLLFRRIASLRFGLRARSS